MNAKDTDSLFEKAFAKYPFNSEKKSLMLDKFNKSFSFSIDSPLFKKAIEVLRFVSLRDPILYSDMFIKEQ